MSTLQESDVCSLRDKSVPLCRFSSSSVTRASKDITSALHYYFFSFEKKKEERKEDHCVERGGSVYLSPSVAIDMANLLWIAELCLLGLRTK